MNAEQTVRKFFELIAKAYMLDKQAINTKMKAEKRALETRCITYLKKSVELTQLTWREGKKDTVQHIARAIVILEPSSVKVHLFEKISEVAYIYRVSMQKGDFMIKVIKESAPYKPDEKGTWGVNITSIKKAWN